MKRLFYFNCKWRVFPPSSVKSLLLNNRKRERETLNSKTFSLSFSYNFLLSFLLKNQATLNRKLKLLSNGVRGRIS